MEVQQVGLDREGFLAKGGPLADIGHRIKTFVAYSRHGYVDTVAGHDFFVAT
jgi:hypothetical protein